MNLDGTDYELPQVHFHSPGEHGFAGNSGPVELHFVHRGAPGTLAVLGFLVQPGATHPAWQPFVDALRTGERDHAAIQLDWPKLVPASPPTIRYAGSLTTPPCSEGVQWLVARDPLALSTAQIYAFTDAYSGNNRPRQPLGVVPSRWTPRRAEVQRPRRPTSVTTFAGSGPNGAVPHSSRAAPARPSASTRPLKRLTG